MSSVRVRVGPRKVLNVDVRDGACPLRACFWITEHITRSAAGMSGCSSRHSGVWECGTRDQRGCPPDPEKREIATWRRKGGAWEEIKEPR